MDRSDKAVLQGGRGSIPAEPQGSLEDVYRLRPRAIWERLKLEPLHFWLFCAYIFFEYVRPHVIYPAIDVLPWGRLLILGALFAVLFDRNASKSLSGPLTFPVLGCFAIAFLSSVFAFDPGRSIGKFDVLVNWMLVYALFLWVVNTKFRLFIVFLILLLASFKMAQFAFRTGLSRGFAFQRWGASGASGWFRNAADLGVQMAIFTAWSVAFYYGLRDYWKNRLVRWLFLFFPIAGIGAALTTGQRNTALAFAAMALALVAFSKDRARNLLLVAMAGLVVFSIASDEFKARFEGMQEAGTAQTRLHYWKRGLQFYLAHPVIGVGYENYRPYYAAHHPDENYGPTGGFQVAHSVPVTVAAETGTLGLIFFYLTVLMVFVTNLRSSRMLAGTDPPFWRYFAISLNYGLLAYLVAGMFLSIAFYPFLWYQAGLTASLYGIACRERRLQFTHSRATGLHHRRTISSGPDLDPSAVKAARYRRRMLNESTAGDRGR